MLGSSYCAKCVLFGWFMDEKAEEIIHSCKVWIKSSSATAQDSATRIPQLFGRIPQLGFRNWDSETRIPQLGFRN